MARKPSAQPTEVELRMLNVLWDRGPSTVREIHNHLAETKQTSYATTVKMLLVMFEKGLVKRDDSRRPLVYRAAEPRRSTQRRMLKDLIQRAYDGSAASLVLQVLSSQRTSRRDLDEIHRLVDELKRKTS